MHTPAQTQPLLKACSIAPPPSLPPRYKCAYTGADSKFYEPSKSLMKKMAFYYDIPTAPFTFIYDVHETDDEVARQQCAAAATSLK